MITFIAFSLIWCACNVFGMSLVYTWTYFSQLWARSSHFTKTYLAHVLTVIIQSDKDLYVTILSPVPWPVHISTLTRSSLCDLEDYGDVIKWKNFPRYWPFCAGNSPVTGEFPAQRPVTRSFAAFFDLRLNKKLSKQSWGWLLETTWRPLRRHCNVTILSPLPWPVHISTLAGSFLCDLEDTISLHHLGFEPITCFWNGHGVPLCLKYGECITKILRMYR